MGGLGGGGRGGFFVVVVVVLRGCFSLYTSK